MKTRRKVRRMIFPIGSAIRRPTVGLTADPREKIRFVFDFHGYGEHGNAGSPVGWQPHPVLLRCDHLGAVTLRVFLKLCQILLRIGVMVGKGQRLRQIAA